MEAEQPKKDNQKSSKVAYNKFILNQIYPDVNNLFLPDIHSIIEVGGESIVVLDTNVLLLPYNISSEGFATIGEVYKTLKDKSKIFIPERVVREFASNRGEKLSKVYQRLLDHKSKKPNFSLSQSPIFENYNEYKKIKDLEIQIKELYKLYMVELESLVTHVEQYSWNDPISQLYGELFEGCIVESDLQNSDLEKDNDNRNLHNIAPGYKDKAKDDAGIGDKIIWSTIISLARKYKSHLIFVTNEEKADWWHNSGDKSLYPKFELVDEYKRESGGKSFNMTHLSNFLNLFKGGDKVVDEVRVEEASISTLAGRNINNTAGRSRILEVIYDVTAFINDLINFSQNGLKEKMSRYADVKGINARHVRVAYSEYSNEYNSKYLSKAKVFRDILLQELGMVRNHEDNYIYASSRGDGELPQYINNVIDDLENLHQQLLLHLRSS